MKKLLYTSILFFITIVANAQYGTITFYQDTVVVMQRLKLMKVQDGAITDSIITHKANGNIGKLHMNQLVIHYDNITGTPIIPTNNNQLINGNNYLTGITSTQVTTALGYIPTNPNGNASQYIAGNGNKVTFPAIPTIKRTEAYNGTTSGSGTFSVVYSTPYISTPIVIPVVVNGTVTNSVRLTASSTTGFTVTANNSVNVLGLLPSYPTLNGVVVDVYVSER